MVAVAASVVVLLLGFALLPGNPPAHSPDLAPAAVHAHGSAKPKYIIIDEPREDVAPPSAPPVMSSPLQPATEPLPGGNRQVGGEVTAQAIAAPPANNFSAPVATTTAPHVTEGARADTPARVQREHLRPTPARPGQPVRVALLRDVNVGCHQDQTFTREACKAIRCTSREFASHPVCVRRVAEQRALDARRELHGGS